MSNIYNCEQIKRRIENHSHYGKCFNGDIYKEFSSKRELLNNYKKSYDEMISLTNDIININYKSKNREKESNNIEETSKIKYENSKKKYEEEQKLLILNNENKIQEIIHQNELKKIEIEKLQSQNDIDIDYKKKLIINKIKNDYKLKLVKYKNEKEKEKTREIALYEIKKKNFEMQKELEINKMKNLSLIIQELITIFKTSSINN